MKNKYKIVLALIAFMGITSCTDDDNLMFSEPVGEFKIVTPLSGDTVILNAETPNNPGIALTWEDMDYTTPTEVTYTVQMAPNGSDFSDAQDLTSTTSTFATIPSDQLNVAAIQAGAAPGVPTTLDIRIKATTGTTGSQEAFSNTINYTVTTYLTYLFKDYYLVGAATMPGWDNNNATSPNPALWRDPAHTNQYEFTGYFIGGGGDPAKFKFLEVLGQWQPQWGPSGPMAASGTLAGNPGTQSNDPTEFQVTGPSGYYKLSVNMDPAVRTYTFAAVDASAAPTYTTVGLIGTAVGGWGDADEIAMDHSTFDTHLWYKKNITLSGGELKFRANNAWSTSWGASTAYSGRGTGNNDPNIPVTATNYNVWFNDLTGQYMLIPIAQ